MKKITLLLLFLFISISGYSQLALEGFENTTGPDALPSTNWTLGTGNWAVFDNGIGSSVRWGINSAITTPPTVYQGVNAAYVNRENIGAGNTSEEYLATPPVLVPTNGVLHFYTRMFTSGNQGTIYQIKVAPATASQADPFAYSLVQQWTEDELIVPTSNFNIYTEKTVNLPFAGQFVYVAFVKVFTQPDGNLGGDRWLVDNVSIDSPCLTPTALTVSAITANGATLNWTNPNGTGSASYEIEVVLASGTPTGVATNTTTAFPYVVTGLLPNTAYKFYVRAICTTGFSSPWSVASSNFTTLVAPPVCGGNFVDSGGVIANYANNANVTTTICPTNPGDLVTVTFTSFNTENGVDLLKVYDGNSAAAPLLATLSGTALPPAYTASSASGCLTFVFTSNATTTAAGWVSNVTCAPPPACRIPTAVTAVTPTTTSVTLNWTQPTNPDLTVASTFDIIALSCGSPAPTAASIPTANDITANAGPSYVLSGLTPATCYDIYIRAVCATNSGWNSVPATISTLVAPPVCGGNFVDSGGTTGNYGNNANLTTTICPVNIGDAVTITFTAFNTQAGSDLLKVYDGDNASATLLATLSGTTLPPSFTSSAPSGCLTFVFTSDATTTAPGWLANVTCAPAPACPKPVALTTAGLSPTSVSFGWTAIGTSTSWQVLALPCTAPTPTNSTTGWIATTTNSYIFTGLNAATCYNFYVRSDCGGVAGLSEWAGPKTFTTTTPGLTCAAPIVVTTLPYNTSDNTSNFGDNSSIEGSPGASGCGSANNYLNGNDVVYSFNATFTGIINVAMTPTATYSGIFAYSSCANIGVNCLAGVANSGTGIRTFDLPVTAGSTYYFVISTWATPQTTAYTLTIQVVNCAPPVGLPTSSLTMNSANLSWSNPSGATSWEVAVQTAGSPIPSGSGVTAATNTNYNVSGLTSATAYQYYVRADCGNGTFSAWAGPYLFNTSICAPSNQCNYTFTMTDGFGDGWNGGIMQVRQNGIVVATLTGPTAAQGTTPVNVTVALCDGVPFDLYWSNGGTFPDEMGVSIKEALPPQQTIFTYVAGTGSPLTVLYSDTAVCTPPTCPKPTAVTFTNHTQTGASISWTEMGSATQWQVLALPCGSPAPTASSTGFTTTPTNPFSLTGLAQATCYSVYVRAVCSASDISFWSNPTQLQALPPNCATNPAATDTCVNAPFICNLNGYCGNTSAAYTPTTNWPQLITAFCAGSDDNDSFIQFVASASTIALNVWVTSSQNGDGIQIMVFSAATCGSGPVTSYGCYNAIPANAAAFPVIATGLTPGNTYYVIIDGNAGDVCNYIISVPSNGGISTQVTVTTTNTNLCTNGQATLNAAGGNGIYNWTVSPASTGLSATTGSSVTFTPTVAGTYTITATSTDGNLACPQASTDSKTIVVTDTVSATIGYGSPSYCTSIAISQPVIHSGATGGNYSASPSGLSIDATSGAINPSLSTAGTYQVNYTILANGGCPDFVTSTPVEIIATPTIIQPASVEVCDSYQLPSLTVGNYFDGPAGTGNQLNAGDVISTQGLHTIYIYATNNGCSNEKSFTVTINKVPTPTFSTPTPSACATPTGTVTVLGPTGTAAPLPANLFISEVTDATAGSLTYVEIYNGTGAPVNLSNYKLRTFNNGSATFTAGCDNILTGTLNNNTTYVIKVSTDPNIPGFFPDQTFTGCGGVNFDDCIKLMTLTNTVIDLWGRTDGVAFTPLNQPGYTYRRLNTATLPSTTWNPVDWSTVDPENYSNLGSYSLVTSNYQYSIDNGVTYQPGLTFTDLAAGNHILIVKDLITGCLSAPVNVLIDGTNPTPSVTGFTYVTPICQNATNPQPDTFATGFTTGGTFSEYLTTGLVFVNTSTGEIDLANSTPGSHTIRYNVGATCIAASSFDFPIVITPVITPVIGFSYSTTSICKNAQATLVPIAPGLSSYAQFVVTPATGLAINPNTGVIDLANSTPGNYSIIVDVPSDPLTCRVAATTLVPFVLEIKPVVTLVTGFNYGSPFCGNSGSALPNPNPGFATGGTFSSTTGLIINSSTGAIDLTSTPGAYTVTYNVTPNTSNCEVSTPGTTQIMIIAPVTIELTGGCQSVNYVLTAMPVNGSFVPETATYSWHNAAGAEVGTTQSITVTVVGTYTVTITVDGCSTVSLPFDVTSVFCVIQKGISVNNDGLNDTFDLTGFDVKKLTIFNRLGMKVYSRNNYVNEWGGKSDAGNELPDGTYYFIIDRNTGETKTGWIYINRAQ